MNRLLSRAQLFKDQIIYQLQRATKTEYERSSSMDTTRLEERILLSASPLVEFAADAIASQQQDSQIAEDTTSTQQSSTRQVVFVDSQVQGFEQLVVNQFGPDVQVFVLDSQRDGIEQITETLKRFSDLDAVHLVSHGTGDSIQLGNVHLSNDNLPGYAAKISNWGSSLGTDADVLVYGCDLAGGEQGRLLVNSLASLTGADFAASDDLTGHSSLGGDWDLEYSVGAIETQVAFAQKIQNSWWGVLDGTENSPQVEDKSGSATDSGSTNSGNTNSGNTNSGSTDTVQVGDLKGYLESLADGTVVVLEAQDWYYSESITVTAKNLTIDFNGTEINRVGQNDFIIKFTGHNNTISNLILDGQFDFTASDITPSEFRNEGLRSTGYNNVFNSVHVKDLAVSAHADAFEIRGDNNKLFNCSSTNAGNASINFRANNILVDNFTSHYTAETGNEDITWASETRPRHITGAPNYDGSTYAPSTITVRNSSFTSDGVWAYFVIDSPTGLENLNFTNNTIDQTGAEFQQGTSVNQRFVFKVDNIDNLLFEDNTFAHGKNHVMDILFVGSGIFTGNRNVGDGYYALFTSADNGGSLSELHISHTQWGVNAQIPWAIGRSSTVYETDVRFASISDSNAYHIADDVAGRPNPNRAAIWGHTAGGPDSSMWSITDSTFEFLGAPGIVIDQNESTLSVLTNVITYRMHENIFDSITPGALTRSPGGEFGTQNATALPFGGEDNLASTNKSSLNFDPTGNNNAGYHNEIGQGDSFEDRATVDFLAEGIPAIAAISLNTSGSSNASGGSETLDRNEMFGSDAAFVAPTVENHSKYSLPTANSLNVTDVGESIVYNEVIHGSSSADNTEAFEIFVDENNEVELPPAVSMNEGDESESQNAGDNDSSVDSARETLDILFENDPATASPTGTLDDNLDNESETEATDDSDPSTAKEISGLAAGLGIIAQLALGNHANSKKP